MDGSRDGDKDGVAVGVRVGTSLGEDDGTLLGATPVNSQNRVFVTILNQKLLEP